MTNSDDNQLVRSNDESAIFPDGGIETLGRQSLYFAGIVAASAATRHGPARPGHHSGP
jgi:hypothetical protein